MYRLPDDKKNRHKAQMTVIPVIETLLKTNRFDVVANDTVILSAECAHIILEHGHRSTRKSYGRPSQNSIKDRLLYMKDQLGYDPLIYAVGHYHRFIFERYGKTFFISVPAVRYPDNFHFNKSIYLEPTVVIIDVYSKDRIDAHLVSISPSLSYVTSYTEVDV